MHRVIFLSLLMALAMSLEIECGHYHNCVYESGETEMKCFGWNIYEMLGLNDTDNRGDNATEMGANLPFFSLGSDFAVDEMSLGVFHACAVSNDKAMKCFGDNFWFQLGFDHNSKVTTDDALPFVEFDANINLSRVAAGEKHTCALSTDANLKCFGLNDHGQCGAGNNETAISGPPSQINAIDLGTNFTAVDMHTFNYHVCVRSQQRTLKCFGDNSERQLGYGDTATRGLTSASMGDGLPTVNLGSDFFVAAIATGGYHTCALSAAKTVKCWGQNAYGQCGTAHSTETGDDLPVLDFGGYFVPMQLALGYSHTCILSENATIKCFGDNAFAQLGTDTSGPIDLGADFVPRKISAGAYHTCAVSTDDGVKCWGRNEYGQLGLGHTNNIGGDPAEMGDNLPFVNVAWNPTTAPSPEPIQITLLPSPEPTTLSLNPTTPPTLATLPPTKEPTTSLRTESPTAQSPTAQSPTAQSPTLSLLSVPPTSSSDHQVEETSAAPTLQPTRTTLVSENEPTSTAIVVAAIFGFFCVCMSCIAGYLYHKNRKANAIVSPAVVAVELAQVPPTRPHDPVDGQWKERVRQEQEEHKYDAKVDPNLVMAMEVPGAERQPGEAEGAELTLSYEPQAEGQRNSMVTGNAAHMYMPREQSVTNKRRSSDSSVMMHEDHYAVRKVTNYYGIDDAQKLDMFEIDEQNGADTKGNSGQQPIPHHYPSPKDDTAADYCE